MNPFTPSKSTLFASLLSVVLAPLVSLGGTALAGPAKARVVRVSKRAPIVSARQAGTESVEQPQFARTKLQIGSHRPTPMVRPPGVPAAPRQQIVAGIELGGLVYGEQFVEGPVYGVRLATLMPDSSGPDPLWFGAYGRLQLQPEHNITRAAAGMTAAYSSVSVEAGIVAEHHGVRGDSPSAGARLGGELLVSVAVVDVLSLYGRRTLLGDDEVIEEAGIRLNLPLVL